MAGDPGPERDETIVEVLRNAAYEAERGTGRREETDQQLRRGVVVRLARIIGGFALIGVGISLLVLPGPGWVMIIIGLSLLPFTWAERTIRAIRRRVPGIPDDGRIPTRTWVMMGVVTVGALALALLFGDAVGRWISGTWSSLWT